MERTIVADLFSSLARLCRHTYDRFVVDDSSFLPPTLTTSQSFIVPLDAVVDRLNGVLMQTVEV
jgi:hypothetical protein